MQAVKWMAFDCFAKGHLMKGLWEASNRLLDQPMFKILATVQELERQGKDMVHFEIGDPDFATPSNISNTACAAICNGETHYTSYMGLHEFRLAACNTKEISRGFHPGFEKVLVTPSMRHSNGCFLLWYTSV